MHSRWGAIANPHAEIFYPPSTPKSHPWVMTPATESNSVQYVFNILFVRTHTKIGINILELTW